MPLMNKLRAAAGRSHRRAKRSGRLRSGLGDRQGRAAAPDGRLASRGPEQPGQPRTLQFPQGEMGARGEL